MCEMIKQRVRVGEDNFKEWVSSYRLSIPLPYPAQAEDLQWSGDIRPLTRFSQQLNPLDRHQ